MPSSFSLKFILFDSFKCFYISGGIPLLVKPFDIENIIIKGYTYDCNIFT